MKFNKDNKGNIVSITNSKGEFLINQRGKYYWLSMHDYLLMCQMSIEDGDLIYKNKLLTDNEIKEIKEEK